MENTGDGQLCWDDSAMYQGSLTNQLPFNKRQKALSSEIAKLVIYSLYLVLKTRYFCMSTVYFGV